MPLVPEWAWIAIMGGAVLLSGVVLLAASRPGGRWGALVRSRLVLGIPVGTILSVAVVLVVYLVIQDGLSHWAAPTQIPFRAWSYTYPLGMAVAPFAHASPAHLTGNLVGALTLGTLAEYSWSHFPATRGETTFSTLRTNPYARALAFVGGVLGVGLLTSLFSLGPVIGFSGVVFAFAGFALVRYPLATILALVGTDVLRLLVEAVRSPTVTAASGSQFSTPWFAGIAIHGHYFGVLVGALLGVGLLRQRGVRPKPGRLWFATLVFGVDQALWALYTPLGGSRYLLLRALGLAVVLVFSALIVAGARATARPLVPAIDLSRREAAIGLLMAVVLATGVVAVPFNLLTVDNPDAGAETPIQVRDYTVYYAEEVPHQLVPATEVPLTNRDARLNVSGVIVASEARDIWWPELTATELAARGEGTIYLGGAGWRRPVRATRPAWITLGGQTAYKVYLQPGVRTPELAFSSDPATVRGEVAGRNISLAPTTAGFEVVVAREGTAIGRAPVPTNGSNVDVGGLTFRRRGPNLIASTNGTRIRVARRTGT